VPPAPSAPQRRVSRTRLRAYHRLSFFLTPSPDGRYVAYGSAASGNLNLWIVEVESRRARQVTAFGRRAVRSASWSPDGRTIVIAADRDGDEDTQLFRLDAAGGWPEPLVTAAGAKFEPGEDPFSSDSVVFAFSANDRDPAQFDVCEVALADGGVRRLWTPPDASMVAALGRSPDGHYLLAATVRSNTDIAAWVIDGVEGGARPLLEHEAASTDVPVAFSADAREVYLITDRDRDYRGLAVCAADGASWRYLYAPDHDILSAVLSPDRTRIAVIENVDGYALVRIVTLSTGTVEDVDALPHGYARTVAWSPQGDALYAVTEDPRRPAELYRVDLVARQAGMLTDSWIGAVDREALVAPELVHIPGGDDGVVVPVFVYRPHGASAASPVPVVLSIHGGPESQESAMYMYAGFYQSLLAAGIGVVAPNVRGSTGFGIGYQKRILRDWGGGELRDLRAVSAFMAGLDWARPDRMAVFGGSFGGFATLSVASRLPEFEWAAAVAACAPGNLVSFAGSVPPSWRPMMRGWVGDPDDDRDLLVERSPISYAHQVRAPLFVLQGALDPRVVEAEATQMVEAVRQAGTEVRYDVYPDEGHGFVKEVNNRKAFDDIEDFLEEHLLGAVAPSDDPDGPIEATPVPVTD
jgi:dipeptidyl aminopeptidase/acylaminoacyl peptidase